MYELYLYDEVVGFRMYVQQVCGMTKSAVVKNYNTQSLVLTRLPTPDEFCVRTDAKETVTNNALWRKCNKTPVYSISVRVTRLYDQSF